MRKALVPIFALVVAIPSLGHAQPWNHGPDAAEMAEIAAAADARADRLRVVMDSADKERAVAAASFAEAERERARALAATLDDYRRARWELRRQDMSWFGRILAKDRIETRRTRADVEALRVYDAARVAYARRLSEINLQIDQAHRVYDYQTAVAQADLARRSF